jgi:4-hydroxy-tetrahydrodipicolinate synthase
LSGLIAVKFYKAYPLQQFVIIKDELMTNPMFKGSIVALITPFKDGKVDEKAFADFVNWQIEQGTDGLVPVGTTGETPTLSHEEHRRVVEICVEVADKRVPVIAGCGSNSTAEAVGLFKFAKQAGADAGLVVAPYYNKPNQEGLYQHFKAVHDSADLPLVLYNVPGRTIADISVETVARLAKLKNIVGIKDATADLVRPVITRLATSIDFCQLSGEDGTILAFMAQGGHGCISVTGNAAPKLCSQFHQAWMAGDLAEAQEINDRLMPLHQALFSDTSPGPVKYAVAKLGMIQEELRLPLVKTHEAARTEVDTAMRIAGLSN